MFKVKGTKLIVLTTVSTIVLLLSCLYQVNILLTGLLLVWSILFVSALSNIRNNVAVFCFLVSYFVFLIGRQVVYAFFERNEVYSFLDITNDYTYIVMIISLVSLSFGSLLASDKVAFSGLKKEKKEYSVLDNAQYCKNFSTACRIVFYFCYLFSLYALYLQIVFVRRVGYLASYTVEAGGAGIPTIVSYFAAFTPLALSFYLASFPTKKAVIKELVLYEVYGLLTVFTGQRYPFIGISMFLFSYLMIRARLETGWLSKKYCIAVLVALPFLILFNVAFDSIRLGYEFDFRGIGETIITFFDLQGGSINTIRRTIYNAAELEDLSLVSFGGTYSAVFENFIARTLFGVKVFAGNSIERAMSGHDFSARLSLIAYGDGYLHGRGTGTSYIAELLHDFGIIGVSLGSVFYGFVLKKISCLESGNKLWAGIGLAMMYYLFFSPRGGFDAFVGGIFRIYSIVLFLFIIILSRCRKSISVNFSVRINRADDAES